MTEWEWRECAEPGRMLQFAHDKIGCRRQRLFVASCCRRIWHLLTDERNRDAVEAGERFADGDFDETALYQAQRLAWEAPSHGADYNSSQASLCAVNPALTWRIVGLCCAWTARAAAGSQAQHLTPAWHHLIREQYAAHCVLLRDIFGPVPFGSATVDHSWLTPTVLALAQAVYKDRSLPSGTLDNDRLAVLADALEDAGCDNGDILAHCRQAGEHVRGCWVVDYVLAKG